MSSPRFEATARKLAKELGYTFVQYVACGAFKETYEVHLSNGSQAAVKVMDPGKCNLCRNERELDSMRRCSHSSIAKLLGSGEVAGESGQLYFYSVEEFLDGGSLANRLTINAPTIPSIVNYGYDLATAVQHLATLNLVHRDIKPENIMFRKDSHNPILVDFGLVRDLSQSSLTQTWLPNGPCTPFYAAPEQLNNNKHLIDWRTDQFTLGIVLAVCLTNKHPFLSDPNAPESAAVVAVGNRERVSGWFEDFATEHNLGFLIRMMQPWPNRRFNDPNEIISEFATRRG